MEMRTRSKGELEKAWKRVRDYNPVSSGGALTSDSTSTIESRSNGSLQTTTDVVTKRYASRRAAGEIFMNPFYVDKTTRATSYSSLTFGPHPAWGRRVIDGTLACYWSVPPNRPSWFNERVNDAKARTLLQAHSRVAEEDFMGLVTVAEAAKTARMIASPFGRARDLVNRIASRKLSLLAKGLSLGAAATSAWLEYRLGWKPVLYDIEGIFKAYVSNELWEEKTVRKVARASDKNISWVSPGVVTNTVQPGVSNVRMRASFSHSSKVSSGVLYDLRDDVFESATARRMGFRLSDVPSTIWEIVPLSWVIDRFVDIGVWLDAIQPKPGVNVLGSWTTTVERQTNIHNLDEVSIFVGTTPATTYTQSGGEYSEVIHNIHRTANPTMPSFPTVNYRDLNLVQQIDHLAVTIALLTGLKVPKL